MTSNQSLSTKKWKYIDFLKGIAIIGVVLVHYNQSFLAPNNTFYVLSGEGAHGVQLFFLISVFLLWNSYSKLHTPTVKDSFSFVHSKFSRIYPLFYVSLLLYIILNSYFGIIGEPAKWQSVLCHVLFVNGLTPHYINDIMGIEWYIADLAILYFFTPILFKWIYSLKRAIAAFLVALIIAFIIQRVFHYFCGDLSLQDNYPIAFFFSTAGFFVQFPCMMLGAVIYYITLLPKDKKYSIICSSSLFVLAFVALFLYYKCDFQFISSSSVFAIVGGAIMVLLSFNNRLFDIRFIDMLTYPFRYLGRNSFSIYLFHFIIIRGLAMIVNIQNALSLLEWSILFFIVVVVTLVIGKLLERTCNYSSILLNKFYHRISD